MHPAIHHASAIPKAAAGLKVSAIHHSATVAAASSGCTLEASATVVIAAFTAISAAAIVITAAYAMKAYSQARYYEKVRLTVAMMESPWLLAAVSRFSGFLRRFGSFEEAQAEATVLLSYPALAAATLGPQNDAQLGSVIGSLTYIATLYAAGYYDSEVLFSRGYLHILLAYFVLDPSLVRMVRSGAYKPTVFTLGRAVAAKSGADPEFLQCFPALRGFIPGDGA